jgi:hypothetical protein
VKCTFIDSEGLLTLSLSNGKGNYMLKNVNFVLVVEADFDKVVGNLDLYAYTKYMYLLTHHYQMHRSINF